MRSKTLTLILLINSLFIACQPSNDVTPLPPSPTAVVQKTPSPLPSTTATPSPTATTVPTLAAPTAVIEGGQAVLGLVGPPRSLNPIIESGPALRQLSPLLFESLLQVDPHNATLKPGLAQHWDYGPTGQQVTFHLPPDLTWSDGSPMSAADIANSLQATQHPALLAFSQIDTPDTQTLRLSFINIDCADVTTIALLPLLPATQILESQPLGSGPFMVTSWSENRRTLTLSKNPHYRDTHALLDGFTVRFVDQDSLAIALSEGQFDVMGPLPADISLPKNDAVIQLSYPASQFINIVVNFNPRNSAPLPALVRQALSLALDRQAILDELLGGAGQLLDTPLLPNPWAISGENVTLPPYDSEQARTLLSRAGLSDSDGDGWLDRDGKRLQLALNLNSRNKIHQQLGWLVSSYYRELGLFTRAENAPLEISIDDLFTHDFSLAIFNQPMLPDPNQHAFWHSSQNQEGVGLNFGSYHNHQVDNLLDEGLAVPGCANADRAAIYSQLQTKLSVDNPTAFIVVPDQHILVSPRLQGLSPGPFAPFTWNSKTWFLQ